MHPARNGWITAEGSTVFFQLRPSTIAGGSSKVQRNIIAKAVLGLPT